MSLSPGTHHSHMNFEWQALQGYDDWRYCMLRGLGIILRRVQPAASPHRSPVHIEYQNLLPQYTEKLEVSCCCITHTQYLRAQFGQFRWEILPQWASVLEGHHCHIDAVFRGLYFCKNIPLVILKRGVF